MKAYQVTDDYEGHACIVFAKGSVQARREGANELGIDFESVESCCRRPEFDQYAANGAVPANVLIADGWWFECHHCGRRVDSDLEDDVFDEGLDPADFNPVFRGLTVFCSQTCCARHDMEKRGQAAAKAALCEWVYTSYPEAHVVSAHVYKDKLEYREMQKACSVTFMVPSCKHFIEWVWPEETVYVAKADIDAWTVYARSKKPGSNKP